MASRRRYTTIAEVEQFADITSTNDDEFEDRITQCEEIIDAYVGYQDQSVPGERVGTVSAATATTLTDTNPTTQLLQIDGYYKNCEIEIIGGTGAGQIRFITDSSHDNRRITIDVDWDTNPDTTSFFRIYQLAKFPRCDDSYYKPISATNTVQAYFKTIPIAIRRAVAAQMEFMVEQGDDFFRSDQSDKDSESIGNYSYSKGSRASTAASVKLVAPKARTLLRGYKNSLGRVVADNPTNL